MSPYWGIEPRAVSPYKAIPAGGRVSCSPLSACLFSRPEERCSADCPYFGLTLWYLGISSHRFCFYVFNFCFLLFFDASIKPLNRSQTRRPDPFRSSAVTTRGLCLYSSGGCIFFFLRSPWHSKSKEYKAVKLGEEYLLLYWRVIIKKLFIFILELAEQNNGDWSFQSLTWEGLHELIVHVTSVQNQVFLGIICITLWAEQNQGP